MGTSDGFWWVKGEKVKKLNPIKCWEVVDKFLKKHCAAWVWFTKKKKMMIVIMIMKKATDGIVCVCVRAWCFFILFWLKYVGKHWQSLDLDNLECYDNLWIMTWKACGQNRTWYSCHVPEEIEDNTRNSFTVLCEYFRSLQLCHWSSYVY